MIDWYESMCLITKLKIAFSDLNNIKDSSCTESLLWRKCEVFKLLSEVMQYLLLTIVIIFNILKFFSNCFYKNLRKFLKRKLVPSICRTFFFLFRKEKRMDGKRKNYLRYVQYNLLLSGFQIPDTAYRCTDSGQMKCIIFSLKFHVLVYWNWTRCSSKMCLMIWVPISCYEICILAATRKYEILLSAEKNYSFIRFRGTTLKWPFSAKNPQYAIFSGL